jgi:hypothetical protein
LQKIIAEKYIETMEETKSFIDIQYKKFERLKEKTVNIFLEK